MINLIRIIILIIVIVLIYYIYDRNIIIIENLNMNSLLELKNYIFSFLDNILSKKDNFDVNMPNFNINLTSKIYSKLPEINCLSNLFSRLYNLSLKYNNTTLDYSNGINIRLEYYFKIIITQCEAVYNDDKPNLQMSYLIDIQHKILKTIHDFIFITSGSKLPNDLTVLENEFKTCFQTINNKLTTYNNKKFIYYNEENNSKINTNSGFTLYPDEPIAKNTYLDNHDYY